MTETNQNPKPTLNTIRQHVQRNPAFSEGGIRHLIFHSKSNGFDQCIRRVGRRVYIHEEAFFEWLESQNQQNLSNV